MSIYCFICVYGRSIGKYNKKINVLVPVRKLCIEVDCSKCWWSGEDHGYSFLFSYPSTIFILYCWGGRAGSFSCLSGHRFVLPVTPAKLQPNTVQIKVTQITVDGKNASCFYYQENIQALKMWGCVIGSLECDILKDCSTIKVSEATCPVTRHHIPEHLHVHNWAWSLK